MDNGGSTGAEFDLLIVGGGVHGAALCREAALAGVRPLLVERADYCSGSSGNSMRTIHGGIRHLQSLDLPNLMESIRAQREFANGFPSAIQPLPCLLPTERSLTRNAATLSLGAFAYNQMARLLDGGGFGRSRLMSGTRLAEQISHVRDGTATRALLWWDGQALDPEGLVMEMLSEAVLAGAVTRNYARIRALAPVAGGYRVEVDGADGGGEHQVRWVVDCTGTGGAVSAFLTGNQPATAERTRAANLVLGGASASHAVAARCTGNTPRSLFVVPWRQFFIVGTWYFPDPLPGRGSDQHHAVALTDEELQVCLEESSSILKFPVTRENVLAAHVGHQPLNPGRGDPERRLLKRARIEQIHGDARAGAYRVLSAKFTEALRTARRVLSTLDPHRVSAPPPLPAGIPAASDTYLGSTFPARGRRMAGAAPRCSAGNQSGNPTPLSDAEIAFAIAAEDVQHLSDLVLRRVPNYAVLEHPETLHILAARLASARSWSQQTLHLEMDRCRRELRKLPREESDPQDYRAVPPSGFGTPG